MNILLKGLGKTQKILTRGYGLVTRAVRGISTPLKISPKTRVSKAYLLACYCKVKKTNKDKYFIYSKVYKSLSEAFTLLSRIGVKKDMSFPIYSKIDASSTALILIKSNLAHSKLKRILRII